MDNSGAMQDGAWMGGGVPAGVVPDGGFAPLSPKDEERENKKRNKKNGNGFLVGIAIMFGLLAIGGVAFGVVMMMNGNKKNKELTSQVESLEEENDDLSMQLKKQISEIEYRPTAFYPVLVEPADYIYVGEWRIKIKKPENWRSMIREYVFHNDYPQAMDTLEIIENPAVATAHALIANHGEMACENVSVQYDACFVLNSIAYTVVVPDASVVTDAFRNFVLNSENYSAF